MFSVNDFKPPDEEAAASAKSGSWIPGEDNEANDTWWFKHHRKKTDNVFYGHGTDIPGALQIASAGKLESSSGTCRNGVYHVGAPANLTALQAIEHLWEATHTTGANGGALVLSTMEGVLVVATGKTSHKDVLAGSKYGKPI